MGGECYCGYDGRRNFTEPIMAQHSFKLNGEFVELHVLLKLLAIAPSGGAAKAMVADGQVSVDGHVETRKACKLRAGQVVSMGEDEIVISRAC
jgi:ribosome-associated protein